MSLAHLPALLQGVCPDWLAATLAGSVEVMQKQVPPRVEPRAAQARILGLCREGQGRAGGDHELALPFFQPMCTCTLPLCEPHSGSDPRQHLVESFRARPERSCPPLPPGVPPAAAGTRAATTAGRGCQQRRGSCHQHDEPAGLAGSCTGATAVGGTGGQPSRQGSHLIVPSQQQGSCTAASPGSLPAACHECRARCAPLCPCCCR